MHFTIFVTSVLDFLKKLSLQALLLTENHVDKSNGSIFLGWHLLSSRMSFLDDERNTLSLLILFTFISRLSRERENSRPKSSPISFLSNVRLSIYHNSNYNNYHHIITLLLKIGLILEIIIIIIKKY